MTALSNETLLYQRLYISASDLRMANTFASHLLKKEWHFVLWETRRRWSTYMRQAAFTTAFVTSYARPFTKSYGWPPFPNALIPFNALEHDLHKHLIKLRNEVYAHSDSASHHVRPIRIVGHPSAIVGSPPLRLTKEELELAKSMISKLLSATSAELARLITIIEQEPNNSFNPKPFRGSA